MRGGFICKMKKGINWILHGRGICRLEAKALAKLNGVLKSFWLRKAVSIRKKAESPWRHQRLSVTRRRGRKTPHQSRKALSTLFSMSFESIMRLKFKLLRLFRLYCMRLQERVRRNPLDTFAQTQVSTDKL